MTEAVRTYQTALTIATGDHGRLYALRSDGAVFVLFKRGDILPNGREADNPSWAAVPAIPGTIAALEQEG